MDVEKQNNASVQATAVATSKHYITREQALAYQHGEAIPAPEGAAKGYALATLHGCPLGWVKCADGLYKNHYPKGLRR